MTRKDPSEALDELETRFPESRFELIHDRDNWWKFVVFTSREIRSYRRYLLNESQSGFYRDRWRRNIPYGLGSLIEILPFSDALISTRCFGAILEKVEDGVPADPRLVGFLMEFGADALVASPINMHPRSIELEFFKAAKFLKIPTIVPVLTWDSLTTKGLYHFEPEKLLVWNEAHKEEALEHHEIAEENIKIIGSTTFDRWFEGRKPSMERGDFFEKYRLHDDKPVILYLGSSNMTAENELWLIKEIREALNNSRDEILQNAQLVVKPHPKNIDITESFRAPKICNLSKESRLPSTEADFQSFYDILYYCDLVVGISTSGMIDAIIANRPVISMIVPRYELTQSKALHFRHLIENEVIEEAHDSGELLHEIKAILGGADAKSGKRRDFVENAIRPRGFEKLAGEFAADEIENLCAHNDFRN